MAHLKAYIQIARLRTLPLSVSGVIVGILLAYAHGYSNWKIVVLTLLTAIGFQILSNFANDYGDGIKGTDNKNRIGPARGLQSGIITRKYLRNVIIFIACFSLVSALVLIFVAFGTKQPFYTLIFFLLAIACILAAVKYTIGKKTYGYSGLGDLFVLLFFGLLSVAGAYFMFAKQLYWTLFCPGFSVGLLSVGVLHLNNMRDRASDQLAQKNTMAVLLGVKNSKIYYVCLMVFAFLFALFYVSYRELSAWKFLFILAFIPITKQLTRVLRNKNPKALDPELKILALSTFLFAVLFGLGQIL